VYIEKHVLDDGLNAEQTANKIQQMEFAKQMLQDSIAQAGGIYSRLRYVRKSKANLQVEKDRSENLLLNFLPEEIAQELKVYGKAEARDFDLVSILFTDFKGFTEAFAKMIAGD
jgi:adenylate cyclase